MEIKVAIFEDNTLVRGALQTLLDGTFGYRCVGAFPDCNNLIADIKRCNPEVVLMDIEIPGMNGIEATRHLSNEFPDLRIIIQTVFDDSEKIFEALSAGASGYLLKSDSLIKYIEAINEVYHGGAPLNPSISRKILSFFSKGNFAFSTLGLVENKLTSRETEILQLMSEGSNIKQISSVLFISYETVRTHVRKIYKKLHVASRMEAIMKARQMGLF